VGRERIDEVLPEGFGPASISADVVLSARANVTPEYQIDTDGRDAAARGVAAYSASRRK
jgi:hypothetical protein